MKTLLCAADINFFTILSGPDRDCCKKSKRWLSWFSIDRVKISI